MRKHCPKIVVCQVFYFFFFLSGIVSVDILSLWRVKEDIDESGILSLIVDLPKLEKANLIFEVFAYF